MSFASMGYKGNLEEQLVISQETTLAPNLLGDLKRVQGHTDLAGNV